MPLIQAIVLGIVQGLSEFLPISSSAHLRVIPAFLHWHDPGAAYSAIIQLGSICAVIIYFWHDLLQITKGFFSALIQQNYSSWEFRIALAILLGTIPICVLGLLFKPLLEADNGPFRSLVVIGTASIIMGIVLFISEKTAKHLRNIEEISVKDGFIIGLGQAFALIPGCSRSGSTLTFALFRNLKRSDAARFSFLLGIPAITLGGIVELKHFLEVGHNDSNIISLLVGLLFSTVASYFAIWWLIKFLQKHSTFIFIAYRLIFGITVLYLALSKQIQ